MYHRRWNIDPDYGRIDGFASIAIVYFAQTDISIVESPQLAPMSMALLLGLMKLLLWWCPFSSPFLYGGSELAKHFRHTLRCSATPQPLQLSLSPPPPAAARCRCCCFCATCRHCYFAFVVRNKSFLRFVASVVSLRCLCLCLVACLDHSWVSRFGIGFGVCPSGSRYTECFSCIWSSFVSCLLKLRYIWRRMLILRLWYIRLKKQIVTVFS